MDMQFRTPRLAKARLLNWQSVSAVLICWAVLGILFGTQRIGMAKPDESAWRLITEVALYDALWAFTSIILLWAVRARYLDPDRGFPFFVLQVPLSLATTFGVLAICFR